MFRKSKADEIGKFFALQVQKSELAVFYLGVSGFIVRSSSQTVLFDPAGMLKDDEVKALKAVNIVLFTHNHLDHFSSGKTEAIFKATAAPILADPKVANKLKGKIPVDKLVGVQPGKTYTFGDLTATAIQGIHRGPIMLYQIKMDDITLFHGGDSGYVSLKEYPSQVAIVPVGRMSPTASPENAFKMVADLKPDVAISMHGSEKQKRQFEQKVKEAMPKTAVWAIESYTFKTVSLEQKA
jgi:L-ascorbate metabolism protein UlaG (beta-lactamase superfamily)